jgi:hypothetical protein
MKKIHRRGAEDAENINSSMFPIIQDTLSSGEFNH